ncbi:hypothetical protein H5V45_07375 [Nocardioides sp. KIGAM211]|uniref:Glycosyl hydrolase family 30 TIM-barrel domain-containing protein n=1 Tax=Nocardioides luti TaxID=2761101 RepID=A0A7X0RHI9_9ACTN|nr:hypothetical protein [Nocardioides luti]
MRPHPLPRAVVRRLAGLLATVLVTLLGAAAHPAAAVLADPAPQAVPQPAPRFWVSSPTDPARRLLELDPDPTPAPSPAAPTAVVIVDPTQDRQQWWGTGAALTDASLALLRHHPGRLRRLFGPRAPLGAHLDLLRLPLSATDFSPTTWSWSWDGSRARPTRQGRALARYVRTAVARVQPRVRVVGAAWSAPAQLKTTGSLRGGGLLPGAEETYADLLVGQARWLRDHGVPLWATSLGNEPGHSSDYPTMKMTDAQLARVGGSAADRLHDLGTRLWAVDHNWADRDRVDAALAAAPGAFDAAAYHCYRGTPAQMAGLAVPSIVTECTGTTGDWAGTFGWDARNLVTDAVAAGSAGLMMWNLVLDEAHGPVDAGSRWGCKTCRGLLTVHADGTTTAEPELFTLAHLSRAAGPGSHVVASSATPGLRVAAFEDPDGTVGVFGWNGSGGARTVTVQVPGSLDASYVVGAGELFTYRTG